MVFWCQMGGLVKQTHIILVANWSFVGVVRYKGNLCQKRIPNRSKSTSLEPSSQNFEISLAYCNILAAGLGRWGCTRFLVSVVGCRCLLGRKERFSMPKWSHKCIRNNQIGIKRRTKTSQGTFKDTFAEQGRKRSSKVSLGRILFEPISEPKSINICPNTLQKIIQK